MDGSKTTFLLGWLPRRYYFSLRECTVHVCNLDSWQNEKQSSLRCCKKLHLDMTLDHLMSQFNQVFPLSRCRAHSQHVRSTQLWSGPFSISASLEMRPRHGGDFNPRSRLGPLGNSTKMHCTNLPFTSLSLPQVRSIMKYLSNLRQITSLQSKSSANRLSVKLLLLPCACHEITHPFNLSSISHNSSTLCRASLCLLMQMLLFLKPLKSDGKQLNSLVLSRVIRISHFHVLINRKIQHLESRAKTSVSGTNSGIDHDWDMTLLKLARP